MAQFGAGLNLAGVETDHAGRCGHWLKGAALADNNYVVLDDGQTLCSLNNNSLSAKTPMGQGAHGGATPEEVLVPIPAKRMQMYILRNCSQTRLWQVIL